MHTLTITEIRAHVTKKHTREELDPTITKSTA